MSSHQSKYFSSLGAYMSFLHGRQKDAGNSLLNFRFCIRRRDWLPQSAPSLPHFRQTSSGKRVRQAKCQLSLPTKYCYQFESANRIANRSDFCIKSSSEMKSYEDLKIALREYNQEHLLKFWDELNDDEKELLRKDICEINFEEVNNFFRQIKEGQANQEKLDNLLKPVPAEIHGSVSGSNLQVLEAYRDEGLKAIAEGQVGVILLAGGQGTRLGVPYPKGMYSIDLPSNKSLFQVQAERILKLQSLAHLRCGKNGIITWYIMTSDATMDSTKKFFKKNNYFELEKNNIVIFEQGTLPCFGFNGKILLDKKFRVSKSPNGNGGLYKALRDEGILEDLDKRGIKYLHTYSVDNILVRVADPVFIGYCIRKKSDCAAKVVEKILPEEAVGVVCDVNGKFQVVEYSEITNKTAEKRSSDGRLTFNAGSICNHFFTTEFLKNISNDSESKLKVHEAKKKIPYVDSDGNKIQPNEVNGIKFEKFVFDVFPFSKNFVLWEVPRDEEFSALKNGKDSKKDNAETARQSVFKLHRKYITDAGGRVIGDGPCEISPLLSYAGEGLKDLCNEKEFGPGLIYLSMPKESQLNGYH